MSGNKPGRPKIRSPLPRRPGAIKQVVQGLFLLGTGRSEGFNCFDGGRDGFLASLSPPIAFLLVLSALLLSQRPGLPALCLMLLMLCAVLLPPVLSHLLARLWRRADRWQRYATASAWSVWLVLPVYLPAMLLASVLLQMGVGREAADQTAILLLAGYFLWLQWFMAWKGLGIGRFKAVLTVLALTLGSSVLATALQPLLMEVIAQPDPAQATVPGAKVPGAAAPGAAAQGRAATHPAP